MRNLVLPAIVVALVISNNVNYGVNGIEGDTDLNDLKDTVKKKLDSLPLDDIPNIDQLNSSIPSLEEGIEMMKEKCLKNSQNNNSFELVLEAEKEFKSCMKSLVNIKELQKEIETQRPTGNLDLVFKKYCLKKKDFENCVTNFTTTLEECWDEGERATKEILQNVTEALMEFICHDDGDRIALFYSEKGPECLNDKQEAIQHCLNTSFSRYAPNGGNLSDLPSFNFEENQCKSLTELQNCVVTELEKCKEPTPANIIGALFDFVRRETPCKKFTSDANYTTRSSITLLVLAILVFLLRLN